MSRICRVGVHTYRQHRIEVFDDGASGWRATIHAQAGRRAVAALETALARDFALLVADAKLRIDTLIEAPVDPRAGSDRPER